MYMNTHSSSINKRQKREQPKCPLMGKQDYAHRYIHSMVYYSEIKRNKLVINRTISVNLKGIILSKRNQSQKVVYCIILFI